MDPNSSLGKICLGDDVVVISSDKCEGSGDSPEYQETACSKGKKVMNALSFYRMETDKISERYIAPCFVNSLEAYDGEINLAFDENLISNEFTIKLCLDYKMKKGKKLVKKELIVALRGELYFVKFIINPKEDDFEPGVILGRSFLRLAKGVVDFGNGVTTIYPEPDPFEDDYEKTGKSSDDWDQLLDFNFDDVPKFREELSPFVCKMGKSNRNKKRATENLNLFYQDIRPSSSVGAFSTYDGVCHQTFRAARFDVLRTAESDSDDAEEYTQGTHDNEARSSRSKLPRQHKTVEELLLLQVYHEFLLWEVCSREAKSRYNTKLAQLLPRHIYLPCVVNWDVLNRMGCDGEIDDMLRIRLLEAGSDEEIFTSVAWIRAFNINEPIYAELFNEFYSTYGFDEVCADMELHRKISSLDWDGDTPKMYRADGGAYNPPGYAQPQYDQYYQQYQPPPPQYQQQQDDDE
ncbi:hypothetical protein Tco_0525081 [Tanacetum coccineum]